MKGLRITLSFLTRIPSFPPPHSAEDLARATPWFPIVGALIGSLTGLVAWSTGPVLGSIAASLLAVGVGLLITGALHEDGLADTFDGLGGGKNRDEALVIMKDSAVGVFGVASLIVALGLKTLLLAELAPPRIVLTSAIAAATARASAVVLLRVFPTASFGLAEELGKHLRITAVAATAMLGLGVSSLLGWPGALAVSIGSLAGLLVAFWARHRIGGLTGDVLGAVIVVTELGVLAGGSIPF